MATDIQSKELKNKKITYQVHTESRDKAGNGTRLLTLKTELSDIFFQQRCIS